MASVYTLNLLLGALALVVVGALCHPVSSLPNGVFQTTRHLVLRGTSTSQVIGFAGNPDLYGIGIRLGYYTQALSLWIANFLVPHEAPFLQTTSTLFMIALFLGMCFLSWKPDGCYAIEVYMLMQISYATARVGTGTYRDFSRTHMIIRDLVLFAVAVYAMWYWFNGLDTMKRTPGGVSDVYFMYTRVDIFGWVRIVFQVLIPLGLIFRMARLWGSVHYAIQGRSLDNILSNKLFEQLQIELLRELGERSTDPAEKLALDTKCKDAKDAKCKKRKRKIDPEKSLCPPKDVDNVDVPTSPSVPSKTLRRTRSLSPSNLRRSQTSSSHGSFLELSPVTSRDRSLNSPPSYTSSVELPRGKSGGSVLPSLLIASSYYYAVFTGNPKYLFSRLSSPKPLRRWRTIPRFSYFPAVMHHFITNTIYYSREYAYAAFFANFIATPSPGGDLLGHDASSLTMVQAMLLVTRLQSLAPIEMPKWIKRKRCTPTFFAIIDILSIYAVFVINTELTIQWNGITGVQSLSSVGQFLPCCFGVGGLVKVLWSGMHRLRAHRKGDTKKKVRERWEECMHCSSIELETARLWRRYRDGLYES